MPKQIKKPWYQQKTFWAGAAVILSGMLRLFPEYVSPEQSTAAMIIFAGLTAIFMREAVENSKPYEFDDDKR